MNAVRVHVCGYDVLVGDEQRGLESHCADRYLPVMLVNVCRWCMVC